MHQLVMQTLHQSPWCCRQISQNFPAFHMICVTLLLESVLHRQKLGLKRCDSNLENLPSAKSAMAEAELVHAKLLALPMMAGLLVLDWGDPLKQICYQADSKPENCLINELPFPQMVLAATRNQKSRVCIGSSGADTWHNNPRCQSVRAHACATLFC